MMKKLLYIIGLLMVFVLGAKAEVDTSGKFYTQVNMWEEKNKVISTNYSRGMMIPVNTEVVIDKIGSKVIEFTIVKDSRKIKLENVKKFSLIETEQLMERTFKKTKVSVSKYSKKVQNAIKYGNLIVGMTKDAVIISRGYPPSHQTPSLDNDIWKYWQNRFVTRNVEFRDGKVSGLVGWGTGNN